MHAVGPFPLPVVIMLLAAATAAVAGAIAARRAGAPVTETLKVIVDTLLIGLAASRLGFVVAWWEMYLENPWSILQISDGGFLYWPGLIAAALYVAWRMRKSGRLGGPIATALASGVVAWTLINGAVFMLQQGRLNLPDVQLARLEGGKVRLPELSDEPTVVNLWATWCPPCRREMPIMEKAQEKNPHITFAFVNQGEGRQRVRQYLRNENLQLENVLLDYFGNVAAAARSRLLPTTLFFNAEGVLVDSHVGALTAAALASELQRFAPRGDQLHQRIAKENPDEI